MFNSKQIIYWKDGNPYRKLDRNEIIAEDAMQSWCNGELQPITNSDGKTVGDKPSSFSDERDFYNPIKLNNYEWYQFEGNDTVYYIPEVIRALRERFLMLQDTKDIYQVMGINPNGNPISLKLKKWNGHDVNDGNMVLAVPVPNPVY
jgi:hypothetical protein